METYAYHVYNPSSLAATFATRSKHARFYIPDPKCRYEANIQNIVWCPVEKFIKMKGTWDCSQSVEEVVRWFAAEFWCDGYMPEKVDFRIAERYYMRRKY